VNSTLNVPGLQQIAKTIRRDIVSMVANANSGHPGGSLSSVEILVSLYYGIMQHDPKNPAWEDRDRFILSKGHAAPVLYSTLAESGYFPVSELMTLRKLDSRLQGHTERNRLPGVEMSAGSLGQGLSFAIGCALAGKLNNKSYRVYALLGDGECDEGQVWEAAMAATHFRADNLCAIVDKNGLQIDGWTRDIMNTEPLADKWRAFGWNVIDTDGHDFEKLIDAFEHARSTKQQPTVIIARTVKGKGVSFMENNVDFHGKSPNAAQLEQALKELA
jgi:transketolase